MEFWNTLSKVMPAQAGAQGSVMETLVGPSLGALGGSHVDDMIGRMTPGAGFRDAVGLGPQGASDIQRGARIETGGDRVSGGHRSRVAGSLQALHSRNSPSPLKTRKKRSRPGAKGSSCWFSIANQTLLETHRSSEFLEAQRKLLRAAMDYRLQLRAVAEEFCETFQIPGRTEVDELARTVHELRREVRALKRRLPRLHPGAAEILGAAGMSSARIAAPETRPNRRRNSHGPLHSVLAR